MTETRWQLDSYNTLNLWVLNHEGAHIHVWIAPRQHYCDRGHWAVHIDAPSLYIDAQDSFPRYFMQLETAIIETEAWLRWRLHRRTATPAFAHLAEAHDARQAFVGESING